MRKDIEGLKGAVHLSMMCFDPVSPSAIDVQKNEVRRANDKCAKGMPVLYGAQCAT